MSGPTKRVPLRALRLLLVIPGAIGDFVLTLPAVAWLQSRFKPAWLELWVARVNLELAQSPTYVDQAVALEDTGIESYPTAERCLQRMQTFDRVLSWWGSANPDFVDRVKSIHDRAVFLRALPQDSGLHLTEFRRVQLNRIFECLEDFSATPRIHWSEEEDRFAREFWAQRPGPARAVIHPGASGQRKRWPAKQFAELARRLSRTPSRHLFLLEGPLDRVAVNQVRAAVADDSIRLNAMRVGNLSRLAAVLSRCQLYIGNDSGITHLAAALGMHTVALFLDTDPRVWAPRGPRVHLLSQPTVEDVFANIEH